MQPVKPWIDMQPVKSQTNLQPKISVLIPAAGMGERLGLGAKAFIKIAEKTLLERAIAAFRQKDSGTENAEIIVALPDSHAHADVPQGVKCVAGGATRQASVAHLLAASAGEYILIHDAARPFLSAKTIAELLRDTIRFGAATTALASRDTLVMGDAARMVSQLNRNQVFAIQTPQGFKRSLILEAHAHAAKQNILGTDDAGLVFALGHEVALSQGDPLLFKVTQPGDFALAEAYAKIWDSNHV